MSRFQCFGFKRNKHKCNLHYAAMLMMTSQILKSAGFTKTQKSRYLENKTFFLQIKKFINYTSRTSFGNSFVAELTFESPQNKPKLKHNFSLNQGN